MNPKNVLLSGIVGSTAYGLQTPSSDIDRLGVFALPTIALHGLYSDANKLSVTSSKPDTTYHEVGKLCRLALGCNPTVSELMWLPADLYEVRTNLGYELIGIRSVFLSAKRVRDAYLGYAGQQFHRLVNRGDGSFSSDTRKRAEKHSRHLARLCQQGFMLYATGRLEVRLENPEFFHDFGRQVAGGNLEIARNLLANYERDFDQTPSPLPERPDQDTVERWLRRVRAAYWNRETEVTDAGIR